MCRSAVGSSCWTSREPKPRAIPGLSRVIFETEPSPRGLFRAFMSSKSNQPFCLSRSSFPRYNAAMAPPDPAHADDGDSRRGTLARRLVELRETALGRPLKGLALASAVGTSKHSLWEWEHGRHIPREQALDALARF